VKFRQSTPTQEVILRQSPSFRKLFHELKENAYQIVSHVTKQYSSDIYGLKLEQNEVKIVPPDVSCLLISAMHKKSII
jgi:hypothetical protein